MLAFIALAIMPSMNADAHVCSGVRALSLVWACINIDTLCMRAAKTLASLRLCTDSPEPSLFYNAICTFTESHVMAPIFYFLI